MTLPAPILVALAVFIVAALLIFALFGEDDTLRKRLHRVTATPKTAPVVPTSTDTARKNRTDSAIPAFDRFIKAALPHPDQLRARLVRTGRAVTLGEYLLINAVSVFIFALLFSLKFSPSIGIGLGLAIGLLLPHRITGRMGDKRTRAFLSQFPEAIDTMCRGLRAGLPISEAIASVGREMPAPVGVEFRQIDSSVRMGKTLEDSMWDVSQKLDIPEFRFLIIALTIQRETGGNLAETMGNLADLLRRRRQMKLKIRALSSEARASAMIIGSLPFLMFCLLLLVNPSYVLMLFHDIRGYIMVAFGLGMIGTGALVMGKMVRFDI
jgi:tight adherence protein B